VVLEGLEGGGVARPRRSGELCPGGAKGARRRGLGKGVDGVRGGVPWAPFCRAAANLGVRARGWETGEIPGGSRGRALREEGDGSGKWGRARRERGAAGARGRAVSGIAARSDAGGWACARALRREAGTRASRRGRGLTSGARWQAVLSARGATREQAG